MAEPKTEDHSALPGDQIGEKSTPQHPRLNTFAMAPSLNVTSPANSGILSIFAYCFSSILMVITNKYVLSGLDYNLNFLLLAVQVCSLPPSRPQC
jgi:GDP-mannose transporter